MTNSCTDNRDGMLLFPYELGILSPEETERFEIHLLRCSYCHDQLLAFEPYAAALCANRSLHAASAATICPELAPASFVSRLRRIFWPPVPVPLRPAVLVGLIALLLYPSASWLVDRVGLGHPHPVTVLVLSPMRSNGNSQVATDPSGLVISLPRPEGVADQVYRVRVKNSQSRVIFEDAVGCAFDPDGWRHLFFADGLAAGDYRLTVLSAETEKEMVVADYWFTVR